MQEVYLTKEGYQKLVEELEYLKTVKRREITKAIAEARAHGDLSENDEYDAAKDAQGRNEQKVAELEFKLSHVRILDDLDISSDEVLIGATIAVKNLDTGEDKNYTLVSELESDFSAGKISVTSPLGQGFLGHKVGEEVGIRVPAGLLRFKILSISR